MKQLSIILTVTGDGAYLRETAEAALAAASALRVETELIVALHTAREKAMRKQLRHLPCRLCASDTASPAALCNAGERAAKGQYLLFLEEGVILTEEGLRKMLDVLLLNDEIAAVGPFCNRTNFAWQYINAEAMEEQGEHPADWVRTTLTGATESLFLEGFALIVRRSAFQAVQGFDEAFTGGGADLDLSFRLKYEGFHLLRTPVYLAHRAANSCELYDMVRTEARPLLMERWGIDIGLPETILQETLGRIVWTHNLPLVRATARTALCKAPLVSIMIPTYNRPAYFRETLESALSQTYPNVEVVVCDNSMDDRTEDLMQAYRADVRVRYVRNREAKTKEENFMPFEHLAQGEYLQWCMDDDILLPDKITLMVDAFLSEPTATLVTSVRGVIDGEGRYLGSGRGCRLSAGPMDASVVRQSVMQCSWSLGTSWANPLPFSFVGVTSCITTGVRRRAAINVYRTASCGWNSLKRGMPLSSHGRSASFVCMADRRGGRRIRLSAGSLSGGVSLTIIGTGAYS